jgi:hypothetical protein
MQGEIRNMRTAPFSIAMIVPLVLSTASMAQIDRLDGAKLPAVSGRTGPLFLPEQQEPNAGTKAAALQAAGL